MSSNLPARQPRSHLKLLAEAEGLVQAREDVEGGAKSALFVARSLIIGTLPHKPTTERYATREARIGKQTIVTVSLSVTHPKVDLAFGADRALLAYLQTVCRPSGFAYFDSILEFFDTFRIDSSGRSYARFYERLRRLRHLSLNYVCRGPSSDETLNMPIIKYAFTPRDSKAAASRDDQQLSLLFSAGRYGVQLDETFYKHFVASEVPLPLTLMRILHNKPVEWDFAAFIVARCGAAAKESFVPFGELLKQLGLDSHTNPRLLRAQFRRTLDDKIKFLFADCPAHFDKDGTLWVNRWLPGTPKPRALPASRP